MAIAGGRGGLVSIQRDCALMGLAGVALLMPLTVPLGMLVLPIATALLVWHLALRLEQHLSSDE